MPPSTSTAPPPKTVVRTRTRRRREPNPLDQLPAWRELVPVMDPAVASPPGSGLDALLGGLNPEQRRAVTHGAGPLLVVAGAGTGKTQVITRRIAWLIATRRAKPSEILALTFTDKAAEEMAVRVDQLVPATLADIDDIAQVGGTASAPHRSWPGSRTLLCTTALTSMRKPDCPRT